MNILKNYKVIGTEIIGSNEYDVVDLLNYEDVFVDMPLCMVNTRDTIKKLYVYAIQDKMAIVVTREFIEKLENETELVKIRVENDKVVNDEDNYTDIIRVQKGTDISKLKFVDGTIKEE